MRLDLELLKSVVLALEEDPNRFDPPRRPADGYTWEQTDAHLCALIDLELVDGSVVRTTAGPEGPCPPTACVNWGLTTPGQFFALQLREDSFLEAGEGVG
jgi:hypothetical protein